MNGKKTVTRTAYVSFWCSMMFVIGRRLYSQILCGAYFLRFIRIKIFVRTQLWSLMPGSTSDFLTRSWMWRWWLILLHSISIPEDISLVKSGHGLYHRLDCSNSMVLSINPDQYYWYSYSRPLYFWPILLVAVSNRLSCLKRY